MTQDAGKDEFDHRWIILNQQITRELIEAEAAYRHARAQAAHAGVEFDDSQSDYFDFVDSAEDGWFGYDVNEDDLTEYAKTDSRLHKWVNVGVTQGANPESYEPPETDEWPSRD